MDDYSRDAWTFSKTARGVHASHRAAHPEPAPRRDMQVSGAETGRSARGSQPKDSTMIQTHDSILDTLPDADRLLARRAEIVRRVAPLRAYYGGNGYAAERRLKMAEAKVANLVRAKLEAAGEKVTEPKVDAMTREHPEYVQAFAFDVTERQKWIELEEELADVEHRLRVRNTNAYLLGAEARLTSGA